MKINHKGKVLRMYQKTLIEKNMKLLKNDIRNVKLVNRKTITLIIITTTVTNQYLKISCMT